MKILTFSIFIATSLTLKTSNSFAEELKAPPAARAEAPLVGGWEGVAPVPPVASVATASVSERSPASESAAVVVAFPNDRLSDLTVGVSGCGVVAEEGFKRCAKSDNADACVDKVVQGVQDCISHRAEAYKATGSK